MPQLVHVKRLTVNHAVKEANKAVNPSGGVKRVLQFQVTRRRRVALGVLPSTGTPMTQ